MKKITKVLGCLGAALMVASTNVLAISRPGTVTFTVADGYYHFDGKRHLNNHWIPNIAVGYDFDQHWGVEAGAGLINTRTTGCCGYAKQSVHGFLYSVDGMYRFDPYYVVEPYVIAGVGALSLKPNGNESVHQGNIHAGVGAQVFISDSIALRAEGRDLYTITGAKNDLMANLGITFLFGGQTPCCVKA